MIRFFSAVFIYILVFLVQTQNTASQNTASQNKSFDSDIRIMFLGDLNFGESYQTNALYNRGINIIEEYGYDYMFENIQGLLENSDLTIANLETPLLDSITSSSSARKVYVHWSSTHKTIEYLKKYNITAISLANNHTFDFGTEGLNQTLEAFKNDMFVCFGAGINLENASKPFIYRFISNPDTVTIAVLTGFEHRNNYDSIYNFYAKENTPGVNVISVEKITEQIKELKQKYSGVYIIFFPHWGKNYFRKTDNQTETAHSVIDAGADLIIGHGAHMMQEIEYFNGHWIVYSLGNSVFNAPGRYESFKVKPYSFIAELIVRNSSEEKEKHLKLYPLFTDNLETDYQVRFLERDEFEDCFSILERMSSDRRNFENNIIIKETGFPYFIEINLNH